MKGQCSFKSGAKAFYEIYGYPLTRKKLANFLGMSEQDVYRYIEKLYLGTSMYKYWETKTHCGRG